MNVARCAIAAHLALLLGCDGNATRDGGDTAFACGDAATCNSAAQICRIQLLGDLNDGGSVSWCDDIPTECSSYATCACILEGGLPKWNCPPSEVYGCTQAGDAITLHTSYNCGP